MIWQHGSGLMIWQHGSELILAIIAELQVFWLCQCCCPRRTEHASIGVDAVHDCSMHSSPKYGLTFALLWLVYFRVHVHTRVYVHTYAWFFFFTLWTLTNELSR